MNDNERLLEQRGNLTFAMCLEISLHSGFRTEWERLTGKRIIASNPLDRLIDKATGYDMAVMGEFADAVYEFIWQTLPF